MFERTQELTLGFLVKAAGAVEPLRQRWPDRLVFVTGGELTLFMRGVVPGSSVTKRLADPAVRQSIMAGSHNGPLNAFLARADAHIRRVFSGPLSYASLPWEAVDWSLFDFVGFDHYREARIKDRYDEMLQPLFGHGKPVIVTEFGMRAYRGAEDSGTLGFGVIDGRSQYLHSLPLAGRFVRT